ncbi:c-type cytochrome [methane-oxidizing endosymbiont of Gigantopelta aegis]|uniref:c-type cytochrome n=1 Tax=methane-oxidizing endosymbiont of Gigantopelta aegis TaxID=2794938 RepID=UPI0018DE6FF3|nr:cytochrome c [methane-oxidizing endosymbiont of Gigantopelta aegis]
MNENHPVWASENFWKKVAVWVTAGSFVVLIFLTFDSMSQITAGGSRVPAYSVINKKVTYRFDKNKNRYQPVILDQDEPLFGQMLDEKQAYELINLGKLTIQAKNCMNCHTLLGNGAYYAPDLTKAWLDQGWGTSASREALMLQFLQNPEKYARTYGTNRKMPQLGITEQEAKGIIAYLKWMSTIDTNGFPHNFAAIDAEED